MLSSGATLAAFRLPGYRALWLSSAAGSFGWGASLVAIGWLTLQVTDSSFAVGATFAARLLPALVLGIPMGSLIDRFDRRSSLIAVRVAGTLAFLVFAALGFGGGLGLAEILVLSLGLGVIDTTAGTANQSYAFDLAGPAGATNAIALSNMGGQIFSAVGSIAGGIVLEKAGVPWVFILAAVLAAVAAIGLAASTVHLAQARPAARLVPSATRSMTLILRNRLVTLIALVVIAGEVFGFSSITLFPTFARNVLNVDAVGLGTMSAARSVGGIVGLLLLANLGFRGRGGRLLLLTAMGFGLALVAFSISTIFLLSLVFLLLVGMMSAALDTLGQSLVQHSVGDHERGAAMGVWFFSIGVGPVGGLALGGAAEAIGAPLALAISGATLAMIGAALSSVRALRQLA
jgi:MFS family permease